MSAISRRRGRSCLSGGRVWACCAPSSCSSNRQDPPGEDEQARIYEDIVRALGPGRLIVVRTLDVGDDKPLRGSGGRPSAQLSDDCYCPADHGGMMPFTRA